MNETRGRAVEPASSFTLAIGLLAFTMFVIVTTEFVVVGLLPAMAKDLKLSLAEAGWFVTWFALAAALLGPPLTMLAGRCDPRHVLITAAIVFAAGNLAIAWAPHSSTVVAVRLLQGCALPAIASVAIVAAARLVGAEREGWAVSRVNIGVVAATVLGVPAGAMAADYAGWPTSFVGLALLGLVSAGLVAAWFPRMEIAKQPSMLTEVSLLWRPGFLMHLLLSCVLFAGIFAGYTYIAALLGTVANLDGSTIGWALMGFGLAGAFGNWIAGRVVDRDPLAATAWVAFALAFAMAVAAPVGESLSSLLGLVIGLWGAAHMAAFVITQVRVMRAGREAAAFAMSLNISVCNLGIGLGSTFGGRIADHYGVGAVGYVGAAAATAALLMAVVMKAARSRAPATT
ncbi:MAG: hypothetical protein B7X93_04815 [Hydrogenophilales bacterium 17-61-9]|nr:MAG: hypothetical protein B7X93_04815 [Hydrogenophilales bacterium 17-61-9]